jgi:hypothetical protein
VPPRVLVLLIGALCAAAAGWAAVGAGGSVAPDGDAPVVVGSERIAAAELERAAARSAGARPRRLPAARKAAADRAIERRWLAGEAAALGLRPERELTALRGQVADALVGPGPLPRAARLAAAFDSFHARWRERTRCLPAYQDPYEDRCGDGAGAAAGTCRWMGAATLCVLRGRRWLVVGHVRAAAARLPGRLASRIRAGASVVRLRSRADAIAVARAVYGAARDARAHAAAAARAAAQLAQAARARAADDARRAKEREQRMRDPRLSAAALASVREACRRQLRDSDPYMFGFGMQDVVGQAEGLIAAREALAGRLLSSTPDGIDRAKLRPLIAALAAGDRELGRLAAADAVGDGAAVARRVARLDERTEPERAISRRLGIGDCLARPGR